MSAHELVFALPGGGRALFTDRADGNMSSVTGDGAEHGERARARLRERTGLARTARGRQVHGTVVRLVGPHHGASHDCTREADGHATDLPGVGVMVMTADCLPVALGSPGAVAMLHAGWRGLAAGVLEEGVSALRQLNGGEEIVAVIGPGAGVCCYEVGAEVHEALGAPDRSGGNIDLPAIARERLLGAGVRQVRDAGVCTICDRAFFSHRREGARAGRQVGVAWLS